MSLIQQMQDGKDTVRMFLVQPLLLQYDTGTVSYTHLDVYKRQVRALPRVKKVFIRSGIRYDYLMYDKNDEFFDELVQHHISGQLKVAPEHINAAVLDKMGKPRKEL